MKTKIIISISALLLMGAQGLKAFNNNEIEAEEHIRFVWENPINPEEDLLYIEEEIAIYETEQHKIKLAEYKKQKLAEEKERQRLAAIEAERLAKEEAERIARAEAEEAARVKAEAEAQRVAQAEKEKAETVHVSTTEQKPAQSTNKGGLIGTFQSTAYAVGDGMTPSVTTANGTNVANTIYSPEGYRIIAVDTSVIPMNSIVEVHIPGWAPFLAKASDTGGAINGNIIDLLVSTPSEARTYGRKNNIKVYRVN